MRMSTIAVLTSGGIDSTACIAFYMDGIASVHGIYVDYGQSSNTREASAAKSIADFYKIPLHVVRCAGLRTDAANFERGRNLMLLSVGLVTFPDASGILALGIHSGTSYADCEPEFADRVQCVFDLYSKGAIQIGTPFVNWTKADIWSYCKQKNIPTHLTYSCELGLSQPCGKCRSCRDLEALRAS